MACYCGWTHRVLFKGSPSTCALALTPSHPVTDIAAVIPAPWLRLAIFPSPRNHFHQPTSMPLFLSSLIKWTKGFFWPTFPSIYCPFSLQLNFLMAICKLFLHCFPPIFLNILQWGFCPPCSTKSVCGKAIKRPHWIIPIISSQSSSYLTSGIYDTDHSLLFDVLSSLGFHNPTLLVFLLLA